VVLEGHKKLLTSFKENEPGPDETKKLGEVIETESLLPSFLSEIHALPAE